MSCALRPVSLVLLLGAAFPIALRAQQSPVEITPFAGLYVPTTTVVSPSGTVYKTRTEAETGMKSVKVCTSN